MKSSEQRVSLQTGDLKDPNQLPLVCATFLSLGRPLEMLPAVTR